jgi:DNA-binding IclR family transcriptional regulator
MARTRTPAPRRTAAVERAVALLYALAESGELGTNELARRLGINASTASRLLATLAGAQLVEQLPDSGRYRLGAGVLRLGNAVLARLDLRETARPHLVALAAETGETVTLSSPGEQEAFTVDFVQSPSSVQSVARLGRPSIGHATAVGKILLAFGGRDLPPPPLAAFTPRTITDPEALGAQVERVRERGFAEAFGEREPDLNAIAAPVFGGRDELAAIVGLQGPASRFDAKAMRAALPTLRERAAAISAALGGAPRSSD